MTSAEILILFLLVITGISAAVLWWQWNERKQKDKTPPR